MIWPSPLAGEGGAHAPDEGLHWRKSFALSAPHPPLRSAMVPPLPQGERVGFVGEDMLVHVATIIGAHGIKGEVKVRSFTAVPKDFASYGPLTSQNGHVFEIKKIRPQTDDFICMLMNVADRNAAEALRGTELFVAREKLPPLKEGEFYLSDLQGKICFADGKALGPVAGFQNFGAGELMELASGLLIPVSCIASVGEQVILNLPDGFLNEE